MPSRLILDIDVESRSFQSSNSTSSNGMKFFAGHQPDHPAYSNNLLMYLGNDGQIGIKTENPETDFHIDGVAQATAFIGTGGYESFSTNPYGFNGNFERTNATNLLWPNGGVTEGLPDNWIAYISDEIEYGANGAAYDEGASNSDVGRKYWFTAGVHPDGTKDNFPTDGSKHADTVRKPAGTKHFSACSSTTSTEGSEALATHTGNAVSLLIDNRTIVGGVGAGECPNKFIQGTITPTSPLYANTFVSGKVIYKIKDPGFIPIGTDSGGDEPLRRGRPGLIVSVFQQPKGSNDEGEYVYTHFGFACGNAVTFDSDDTYWESETPLQPKLNWDVMPYKVHPYPDYQIKSLEYKFGYFSNYYLELVDLDPLESLTGRYTSTNDPSRKIYKRSAGRSVESIIVTGETETGESMTSGSGMVLVDEITAEFHHPVMRVDADGAIINSYIKNLDVDGSTKISPGSIQPAQLSDTREAAGLNLITDPEFRNLFFSYPLANTSRPIITDGPTQNRGLHNANGVHAISPWGAGRMNIGPPGFSGNTITGITYLDPDTNSVIFKPGQAKFETVLLEADAQVYFNGYWGLGRNFFEESTFNQFYGPDVSLAATHSYNFPPGASNSSTNFSTSQWNGIEPVYNHAACREGEAFSFECWVRANTDGHGTGGSTGYIETVYPFGTISLPVIGDLENVGHGRYDPTARAILQFRNADGSVKCEVHGDKTLIPADGSWIKLTTNTWMGTAGIPVCHNSKKVENYGPSLLELSAFYGGNDGDTPGFAEGIYMPAGNAGGGANLAYVVASVDVRATNHEIFISRPSLLRAGTVAPQPIGPKGKIIIDSKNNRIVISD